MHWLCLLVGHKFKNELYDLYCHRCGWEAGFTEEDEIGDRFVEALHFSVYTYKLKFDDPFTVVMRSKEFCGSGASPNDIASAHRPAARRQLKSHYESVTGHTHSKMESWT